MHKGFLKTALLLAALAVGLGAFGAHALKQFLNQQQLFTFETGVRYQFYHVFALLLTAFLYRDFTNKWTVAAGYLFITGIVLFCGSLYGLSYAQAAQVSSLKWLGPVTPLGGFALILGWLSLFAAVTRKR